MTVDFNKPKQSCAVIIVTYNSQAHLPKCLQALAEQTFAPSQIIIVDSGSQNCHYLKEIDATVHLAEQNIGFCAANNLGFALVNEKTDFVLFLNPDAFLTPPFIEKAIEHLNLPKYRQAGALTGTLLGFDIESNQPTGKIDSTGIFRSFYGRWYDRDQGNSQEMLNQRLPSQVPALCGALFFCRCEALVDVQLGANEIMDSRFFMYKEDIDLSVRLKEKGWHLHFVPSLIAYHCRGWKKNRQEVPLKFRLLSAQNEIRLHWRMKSPYLLVSFLKYLFVKNIESLRS